MQDVNQFFHVDKVQPCGGLVQDVKHFPVRFLPQFVSQFDSLRFTTGKRVAGLTQSDVAHTDVVENLQRPGDFRKSVKERHGFFHSHAKNIADVFRMTVEETVPFFHAFPKIARPLKILDDIGMGYITLGQSSNTLSGGEAQRIKLAYELGKESHGKMLYVLDEPTTGLHFIDVEKLIHILHRLVEMGNTVVTIEHNLDIVKDADYLIDLGPEGGEQGGHLVACGSPLEVIMDGKQSYTARFLREYLNGGAAKSNGDGVQALQQVVTV